MVFVAISFLNDIAESATRLILLEAQLMEFRQGVSPLTLADKVVDLVTLYKNAL
eukprot:gene33689-39234_t